MGNSNNMYMGGVGIAQRTSELIDDIWESVPFAFVGLCFNIPIFLIFIDVLVFALWPSRTICIIAWLLMVLGACLSWPWFNAARALRRHTKMMRQETENRGNGWAKG